MKLVGFYTSLIFLGVVIVLAAMAWIVLDRKRSVDSMKQLEEKKQELVGIINDAEQVVVELNKFSDYIVSQVNQKNEEFAAKLKEMDEKLEHLDNLRKDATNTGTPGRQMHGNGAKTFVEPKTNDLILDSIEALSPEVEDKASQQYKGSEKVIPLNSRYREVLNLSQKGYTQTDIAKSLNMGKGEIQLILEVSK